MAATAVKEQSTPTPPKVASCAESCLQSFQACVRKAASIHARELSLVEDQLARFSVWTANIRVFIPGRGSLDHRLREAPDVQDAVAGLLEALDYRLQNCSRILESLRSELSDGSLGAIDERFDRSVQGIANDIGLLHKFSNTIRRASKERQDVNAAKIFRVRDDDGNDAEPFLQKVFDNYIRDGFPEVSDNIRQRLANTMLLRRKRILYRRHRYGKTTIRPQEVPSQPSVVRPEARTTAIVAEQPKKPAKQQVTSIPSRSVVQSLAQTATTLSPDRFQKASSPSVVSVSKTVALSNHEELAFPLAPCSGVLRKYRQLKKQREEKHRDDLEFLINSADHDGRAQSLKNLTSAIEENHRKTLEQDWNDCLRAIGEVTCPFCFYALPAKDAVDEKKWKLHVKNDLDAYVCLFEDCDSPEELYNHSDTWLKHMRKHALRWRCTSKSHIEFVGATRDDYLSHMKAAHPGKLTDAQLGVMADRNGRILGPLFKSCPLCGIGKDDGSMEDHIVGHLRFLALKSLPSYGEDVEGLEDPESQKNSMASSRPQSRSTIKLDPDMHAPMTFDEEYNIVSLGLDYGPSRYQPWGGFREYIGRFLEGQRFPDQETNSSSVTDATKAPVPQRRPYFEPPPLHLPLEGRLASYDSSTEFIEESLFDGVSYEERRLFEWGFIPDAHRLAGALSEDDPVLREFVKRAQERRTDIYQPPVNYQPLEPHKTPNPFQPPAPYQPPNHYQPPKAYQSAKRDFEIEPDCAICNSPAFAQCECEARGLDLAVRQAEQRMMKPIFNDIRSWVRAHSQDAVLRGYELHWQRRRELSAKVAQLPWTMASPTTQTGSSRQPGNETRPPTKQEVNEAWRTAVQRYPETLEYYFGLVDLTLPSDDEPSVRDPPLSALIRPIAPDPSLNTFNRSRARDSSLDTFNRSRAQDPSLDTFNRSRARDPPRLVSRRSGELDFEF